MKVIYKVSSLFSDFVCLNINETPFLSVLLRILEAPYDRISIPEADREELDLKNSVSWLLMLSFVFAS